MKRLTSIKTRISIWYTTLMLLIMAFVLLAVGALSYRLAIDNIENDIKLKVSQISNKVGARKSFDIFHQVGSDEEFKNVSIYTETGEYVVGQYLYDVASVPFARDVLRRAKVDSGEYIIYDVFKPSRPGDDRGYWIRGAESVNYANVLGNSVFAIIISVIPIMLILTILGGYYITRKAFLPINGIIKTADNICAENDIKQRIPILPSCRKDELYNLSLTLNNMLDKIEMLIETEKQFTSDASHELRTPVSVILAQGEYLLELASNDKEKELAQSIVDRSNQMSKLVSSLLLLARVDRSRQRLAEETVDIGVLVDIAAESMKNAAESKNITIITNVPDGIICTADEFLLLSVLTNLIGNGIKYGKEFGKVEVSAVKTDYSTIIAVSDDGIGISEEHLDKIWGRFYRVDNVRNDEYGSSGLGLAVVKSIVELHGGRITAESTLGQGSVFTIFLNN